MLLAAARTPSSWASPRPSAAARKVAEKEEDRNPPYSIIYDAINDIKRCHRGHAGAGDEGGDRGFGRGAGDLQDPKVGTVAGCVVRGEGKLQRSTRSASSRDGIVIYTGKLGSLKRSR